MSARILWWSIPPAARFSTEAIRKVLREHGLDLEIQPITYEVAFRRAVRSWRRDHKKEHKVTKVTTAKNRTWCIVSRKQSGSTTRIEVSNQNGVLYSSIPTWWEYSSLRLCFQDALIAHGPEESERLLPRACYAVGARLVKGTVFLFEDTDSFDVLSRIGDTVGAELSSLLLYPDDPSLSLLFPKQREGDLANPCGQ